MSKTSATLPPLPVSSGMISNKAAKKNDPQKKIEITIHVCDEAKNLKKDFTCSKMLLLKEMKYFQDYLSSDNQTWEDIDISVHCDIKIFDWLMRYVKRDRDSGSGPILSAKSAVSILISSDFLKMAQLVDECINFCHDNLSEIIASPCNMNCINDVLVKRIAATFTQNDLEKVVDKKDKFKSKLFCKKIEELFDPKFSNKYCPNNASLLYMCLHCRKMLLPSVENKIECAVSRTIIDKSGNLRPIHLRDASWEIQEYLISCKQKLKTWRNVFWKLWSVVNFLECDQCNEIFPLSEYNCCRYHLEKPVVKEDGSQGMMFPCCGKNTFAFEPISSNSGCQLKEHVIMFDSNFNSEDVFNELLSVVKLVCTEQSSNSDQSHYSLEAMFKTELSRTSKCVNILCKEENKRDKKRPPSQKQSLTNNARNNKSNFPVNNARVQRKTDQLEEDTSELDEPGIVRIVIQHKDAPARGKNPSRTWNSDLPVRLNQDLQRESDIKRMNEMMRKLSMNSTSLNSANGTGIDKLEQPDPGLYCKVENKIKSKLAVQQSVQSSNSSSNMHNKHFKFR